jgi:hypothetical protein
MFLHRRVLRACWDSNYLRRNGRALHNMCIGALVCWEFSRAGTLLVHCGLLLACWRDHRVRGNDVILHTVWCWQRVCWKRCHTCLMRLHERIREYINNNDNMRGKHKHVQPLRSRL